MDGNHVAELIESSDLNGLVRAIDALSNEKDWEGLEHLRDRCLEAVDRGKQVWGVAQFAEYRIALDAPASHAAGVLRDGAGRDAPGPLWEVAASTHTWADLEAHVQLPRQRALVAHERAMRGEPVEDDGIDGSIVDVQLDAADFEPAYPTAEYRADGAAFPERPLPDMPWVELEAGGEPADETIATDALLALVGPWVDQSSGRAEARAVVGTAAQAIRALGLRNVRLSPVTPHDAFARMVWAGASGGAYGRRRGSPVGRAAAWWAAACVSGLEDEWPVPADVLGEAVESLHWFLWDPGDAVSGWNFHLAVEDPLDGLSWAVGGADWK